MAKVRAVVGWIGALAVGFALIGALAWNWAPTSAASDNQAVAQQSPAQFGRPGRGGVADRVREQGKGAVTAAALIKTTADLTEQTPQEVVEALRAEPSQSLAQIAEAKGSSGQAVVDAVVAKARERLDQAVANGRLTQEQADKLLAELTTQASEMVNDSELGQKIDQRIEQGRERAVTAALVRPAADVTSLPVEEIRERMRNGESLAQIITSTGKTTAEVIDLAVENFRSAAESALNE